MGAYVAHTPMPTTDSDTTVLCIDVGGTNTRIALLASDGRIITRISLPTVRHSLSALTESVKAAAIQIVEAHRSSRPAIAGIAFPCPVDSQAGILIDGRKLGLRSGTDVQSAFQMALELPTIIRTELTMAALGELGYGAAQGHSDFVVLTIGTGLGVGVVTRGQVQSGSHGLLGEIGLLPVDGLSTVPDHQSPASSASLESCVSGRSVLWTHEWPSPESFLSAASRGDPTTSNTLASGAHNLCFVLLVCAAAYDPSLIVLRGGFIRAAWPLLAQNTLRAFFTRWTLHHIPVLLSPLCDDGVLLGLSIELRNIGSA
jgi:predicted NBD/HSP70 family sugar kinase